MPREQISVVNKAWRHKADSGSKVARGDVSTAKGTPPTHQLFLSNYRMGQQLSFYECGACVWHIRTEAYLEGDEVRVKGKSG